MVIARTTDLSIRMIPRSVPRGDTVPAPPAGEGQGTGSTCSIIIPAPLAGEGQGTGSTCSIIIPAPLAGEGQGEGGNDRAASIL